MFSKTTLIALSIPLALAAPASDFVRRDGAGSVVTAANALAWYSSSLTSGTSGLSTPSDYTCYSGPASNFPAMSSWVAFATMWNQSVQYTFNFEPDTKAQVTDIYNAITATAKAAKVDARVILATVLLESSGNLSVPCTLSPAQSIPNCGLLQSFNGSSFNASAPVKSINQMITDGTQGTAYGPGLVQLFNDASDSPGKSNGNPYAVFREYNSGNVDANDLTDAFGANPAYVSDMANYLLGWNGYGNSTAISSSCSFSAATPTSTSSTPTAPTATCTSYATAPAPTTPGTSTQCCTWYVPVSGDSCYSVEQKFGLTFAQFTALNPYIDAACDNLWVGEAYCVNGNVASTASSSSVPASTTSASTKSSSTSISTSTKTSSSSTSTPVVKTTSTKTTSTTSSGAKTTTSTKTTSTKTTSTKTTSAKSTSSKAAKAKKNKTPTAASSSSSTKVKKAKKSQATATSSV